MLEKTQGPNDRALVEKLWHVQMLEIYSANRPGERWGRGRACRQRLGLPGCVFLFFVLRSPALQSAAVSLLLAGTQLPVLLKAGQLRVCGGVCTHTGVCKRVQYGERCFASITSMGSTEFPCKGLWGRQEHEAANGLGWVRTALQETRRGISVPPEAGEREEGVGRCVQVPRITTPRLTVC